MVWYVGLVAALNLCLGYGLAVYLGVGQKRTVTSLDDTDAFPNASSVADQHIDHSPDESATAQPEDFFRQPPANETSTGIEAAVSADASLAPHTDPTIGLTTREHVLQRLAEITLTQDALQPTTAALVEVEEAVLDADSIDDRLLHGVADTMRSILPELQLVGRYSDRQFLLPLPQNKLQHATRRTEHVR